MTKIEALELELKARKMVDGTGLHWASVVRHKSLHSPHNLECYSVSDIELALGFIEGKPIFSGDVHYNARGERYIAAGKYTQGYLATCTLNPPKPKTVMVELLVEDAEVYAELAYARLGKACRKALEELK